MTTEDKQLLLAIVAHMETLYVPWRTPTLNTPDYAGAAISERRAGYEGGHGVPWRVGGGDRDRQSGRRSLRRLADAGLLAIHKCQRSDQRVGVSLSGRALSVAPIVLPRCAWKELKRVATLQDDPDTMRNCGFVNEHCVCRIAADSSEGRKATAFIEKTIGLLIAGLLETASDTIGAIGWRVTAKGRAALKAGRPKPDHEGAALYEASLTDEYFRLVDEGLQDRLGWTPNGSTIFVPLSAGEWGTDA